MLLILSLLLFATLSLILQLLWSRPLPSLDMELECPILLFVAAWNNDIGFGKLPMLVLLLPSSLYIPLNKFSANLFAMHAFFC